jgi:16S rRNA (cytosine1402-N4)-methyltransferase
MLNIIPNGIYVDGTAGGGGHSERILSFLTSGKLIMIDRDPDAVARLNKKFQNACILEGNFANMQTILNQVGVSAVDGILLDLGVSSFQLDEASRGFSYNHDANLDMRMSKSGISAYDIVNEYSMNDLAHILWNNSEEKFANRIAAKICESRKVKPIRTTLELVDIIKSSIPQPARRESFKNKKGHPAKRTFQAIRIEVNKEFENLKEGLDSAFSILKPKGILAVITFHSLEDRIVKRKMLSLARGCTCPPDFPICICGRKPLAEIINKKPIIPSISEISDNPRSKSAKLRGIKKL